ncbi:hypothetical protein D9M68_681740 [compost metagenome]
MFASRVADVIRIMEPGTSAVRMPAAPMTPTNQGSNVCSEILKSARSMSPPFRPGTCRIAEKPTNRMNSSMS